MFCAFGKASNPQSFQADSLLTLFLKSLGFGCGIIDILNMFHKFRTHNPADTWRVFWPHELSALRGLTDHLLIWLTDGLGTLHGPLYTCWWCPTWNQYVTISRICNRGATLGLNPNVVVACWCQSVVVHLEITSWHNQSSKDSLFVWQDDVPSSSSPPLWQVQAPYSLRAERTEIGLMSDTECSDKWRHPPSPGIG